MISKAELLQTGYAAFRCALSYGEKYLPKMDPKTSSFAKGIVFALDMIDTAYTGWRVHQQMETSSNEEKERYYTDLAVKGVVLAALAALFVKGTNKYFLPKIDPLSFLQKTNIPKEALDYTQEAFSIVTATWTKPLLENLTTGLFFIRTICNLYLGKRFVSKANNTSSTGLHHALNVCLNAAALYKASQYRTLEIRNSFRLLHRTIEFYYIPSSLFPSLSKYFDLPIKKVDAIFHLNVEGLSDQTLLEKIQAIYDYSSTMFHKSTWHRYWPGPRWNQEYLFRCVEPYDPAEYAMQVTFLKNLNYSVSLEGVPPPAPVQVHILHEDKLWRPFKGIDIFQWLPRFCTPQERILHSEWIDATLNHPLTSMDSYTTSFQSFLMKAL